MMCQHCFYPEVGQALQRMVSSRSDHIYVVPLPDNARGKEFLDVNDLYPEAVLIGVKEAVDGDPARSLVFISRKDPIQEARRLPHRRHRIEEPPSPQRSPAANTEADHTTSFDPKSLLLRGKESANKRDTVIVIGAPSDLVTFITNLERYAQFAGGAKGSDFKIHVLCREKKAFSFLEGDGSRKVTLQEGDTSAPRDLQTLPLKEAFSIMVLAYRNSDDESFAAVDARSLTTVFQLDHLLDEQRRSGENIDEFKVALMCELQDPQSETVVQMNPVFSRSAYFFHSLHMESGLFAAAVCDIKAFNCLMTLLEQNGLDMRCERATAVAPHASVPTSFKKLQKDIHEKDNSLLLIGWKNVDDDAHSPLEANQWQINPEDKVTTFPLKDDSLLLILRNKDAADLARRVASRPESENLDIWHRRSLISSGPSFGAVGRWHLPSRIM
jgi:hypothetical protein